MPYNLSWQFRRLMRNGRKMRLRALILYEAVFLLTLTVLGYLFSFYSVAWCEIRTAEQRNYFRADDQAAYFKTWLSPGLLTPHFVPNFWEIFKKEDFQTDIRRFVRRRASQGGSWAAATDFGNFIAAGAPARGTPPEDGWTSRDGSPRADVKLEAGGGAPRELSRQMHHRSGEGITQVFAAPSTSFFLVANCLIALYLNRRRVDPGRVSFSYESVVDNRDYWRVVTSSFAHFDFWHLLFNMMSLWALKDLEARIGSVPFFFLTIDLVLLTMLMVVLITVVLMRNSGLQRAEAWRCQSAVGFSCVLFAWITAASIDMKEFCPLFFAPKLCFKTYYLDSGLPGLSWLAGMGIVPRLGVNVGPFCLLLVCQLLLPRSSFTGHLAGILIGYPVAWGWFTWLSPPFLSALCLMLYLLALPCDQALPGAVQTGSRAGPLHYVPLGVTVACLIVATALRWSLETVSVASLMEILAAAVCAVATSSTLARVDEEERGGVLLCLLVVQMTLACSSSLSIGSALANRSFLLNSYRSEESVRTFLIAHVGFAIAFAASAIAVACSFPASLLQKLNLDLSVSDLVPFPGRGAAFTGQGRTLGSSRGSRASQYQVEGDSTAGRRLLVNRSVDL